MQNRKPLESVSRFLKKRGYLLAALVCAVAVGVSGYYYVNRKPETEMTLSTSAVPQVTLEPSDEESTPPAQRNAEEKSIDAAALVPEPEPEVNPIPAPTAFTIAMPVEGEYSRTYSADALSYDNTTRDWRTHEGLDILAAQGTEVKAAADGTVSAVYEDSALGNVITVSHENGYQTLYGNLSADAKVSAGQTVHRGDVLGYVGDSALMETAEPEHMHFELSCNALSLDPNDYFSW